MDTELITICNIMTTTESVTAIPSKPNTNNKADALSNANDDNLIQTDTSEITTDNSYRRIHNEAVNKNSDTVDDKSQKDDKSETVKSSQNTNNCTKSDIQTKSPGAQAQDVPVQNYFTEGPAIVTVPKIQKTADNTNTKQQASNSSPHSIVTLKGRTIPSAYLQNVKPVTTEADKQVKTDTTKIQKTVNPATEQTKIKNTKEVSETSKKSIDKNIQKTVDINGTTDVSKKEPVDSKIPVKIIDEQKSPDTVITTDTKTAVVTDKQILDGTSDIKSGNKEVSTSKSNKPIAETPIDSNNKVNTTIENKTDLPSEPKPENNKPFETQINNIKIEPEKTQQTTNKPAEVKTIDPKNSTETSKNNNTNRQNSNESEANTSTRQFKFEDVQAKSEQVKNSDSTVSNKNQDSDNSQSQTQNTQSITEPTNNATSSTKTVDQPVRTAQNDSPQDVGKQIFESIRSSGSRPLGDQQITVRLNPPELGRVFIRFQEQNNQITGILEVSKAQTRFEIEQAIPQIVRNLTDSGVQVRRLEVVLNNEQTGNDTLNKDQLFQNGDSQNQKHANSDSWQSGPNRSEINELFVSNPVYQNNSKLQQVYTSSSLNMLI